MVVRNINKLTLQGLGEMEEGFHWTMQQSNVKLSCSGGRGGIAFINVSELTIQSLTVSECGAGFTNVLAPHLTGLPFFSAKLNNKVSSLQMRLKQGSTGNRALVRLNEEEDDRSVQAREPFLFDSLNQD